MEACRLPPSLVDEVDWSAEWWSRGVAAAGNSDEGMTGDRVGLSRCVFNKGLGASGSYSGDSAGEGVSSSRPGEGMMETSWEPRGEGDSAGESEVALALARVSISTFIPWLQCPIFPQMKYLFPGEVRGMFVVPSL